MKAKTQAETTVKRGGETIHLRPPSDAWSLVICLVFIGGLTTVGLRTSPQHPPSPAPAAWPVALAVGGLFLAPATLPATLLAAYLCRTRVTATETGIISRGVFGKRETPWADIDDFYTLPIPYRRSKEQNHLGRDARIIDRNGRVIAAFNSQSKHASDLKAAVAERATNAKTRTWHVKGARPFDPLPRVFAYNTGENRFASIFLVVTPVAVVALFVGMAVLSIHRSLVRHDFGWWTLGGAGVMLLLGGVYVLLFSVAANGQKATLRAGERFIVDSDGFTFCAESNRERVLWKNVTSYGYAPRKPAEGAFAISYFPPFRIETVNQGAFDFTTGIGDVIVLREIVRVNAVQANQTDWPDVPPVPDEPPGDPRRAWSSGVEGVGERIFHYRTEFGRAFLWFAALPSGVVILLAVFAYFDLIPSTNVQSHLTPLVFCAPPFLWVVWRYYAAQIRVGESGITQRTPWGQTHIAWADIESVTLKSPDPFGAKIVGTNGRVIRWTNGFLAGETELRALLAQRVPTT